ncbi:MAG: HAD hydrolase-like protein [Parachlamydiaceae bacterium]|nr:HAD hydrolase-like protein [Parachlamydiaceae bacterium]
MKLFVWDFHGVLEKGNDLAVVEITNQVLATHGITRRMTSEESFALSGKRWHEYFAFLLPDSTLEQQKILQDACIALSHANPEIVRRYITVNDHAVDVLESISQSEHEQIVISNTQPHSLDLFLKMVNLERYFPISHRFGANSHAQNFLTKRCCLSSFLKDRKTFDHLISIGDSPGDIELASIHPQGKAYLYRHPGQIHREVTHPHQKISSLRVIMEELSESGSKLPYSKLGQG